MVKAGTLVVFALIALGAVEARRHYCGRMLTHALIRACLEYSDEMYSGEKQLSANTADVPMNKETRNEQKNFPEKTKDTALWPMAGSVGKRQRRSIVNECCFKGCSYRDLREYCSPPYN